MPNGNSLLPYLQWELCLMLASQGVQWWLWSCDIFSGVTANKTIVLLSLWLAQNLGQLSALAYNNWWRPSQTKTLHLVMKNLEIKLWKMFFPDICFFLFFPKWTWSWLSLLLAEVRKSKPQQGTPLCLGLGVKAFTWIYILLSTLRLLVLVTHPLISLWVIFCSLCFLSSHRSLEICC